MYSELIYTRCGEGIDILRGRNPIKNSGFKVFSCSNAVTEDKIVDLPFLYAAAQSKESYVDPDFMDDAYLFFVPDIGKKYMLDFHPIPFDRDATGDYSHRPGNFINQIMIGEFDEIYPFELFGNSSIWDAQKRGEAFYYENAPVPLAQRDNLDDAIGYINIDDISEFVSAGRREVLKKAIAFIISQYSLPAEERKYLVIKDENSKAIELWIAAIESAFSPRMASGLSFATRLDKFVSANRYTVNLNGEYQTQINLQSPNQKLRFRAMIVGVDERDRTNSAAAKALANAPYVVLDGKAKTLSANVDAAEPYYEFITSYTEEHEYFCRRFMQMVDEASPSIGAPKLYSAFVGLSKYGTSKKVKDLLPALNILGQFNLLKSVDLERLYKEVKQEIPVFLKEEPLSAFAVMSWLERAAHIVGDTSVLESFRDAVCQSYVESVFTKTQSDSTRELHNEVMKSAFAQIAAENLISNATANYYTDIIQTFKAPDWISFTEFYTDALKYLRRNYEETVSIYLSRSIYTLFYANDRQTAQHVASLYAANNQEKVTDVLLDSASKSSDKNYIRFLIQLVCKLVPDVISSEKNMERFYKDLKSLSIEGYFSSVIEYKAQKIVHTYDMERYLDWILSSREISGIDLSTTFGLLDKKIAVSDVNSGRLATKLQKYRPKGVTCINSAHLYPFVSIDDRRLLNELPYIVKDAASQGFPSIENDEYADRLAKKMFSIKMPKEAFFTIVSAASRSRFYSINLSDEAVKYAGSRQDSIIGDFLEAALNANSEILSDAIIGAMSEMRQFEKSIASIRGTIRSQEVRVYYSTLEKRARELHDQNKGSSFFGRLFSRGSNENDSGKWGKN